MRKFVVYLLIGMLMVAVMFLSSLIGSGQPMPGEIMGIDGGPR